MNLPIYQVDAFTNGPFTGNPAAVCPLGEWLPDKTMQSIALENNLSETAFFVPEKDHFHLRWFTPLVEVDLCGHATLATAFVLFNVLNYSKEKIRFQSRSGLLEVERSGDSLRMDFPADNFVPIEIDGFIADALGEKPREMYKGRTDHMCIYSNQEQVERLRPDFSALAKTSGRGILVTAPGNRNYDFVSRGFFPQTGVDEDPATGSAHTTLTPYWSGILKKDLLKACQLSARKGFFECENRGDRVLLKGKGYLFMKGEIYV